MRKEDFAGAKVPGRHARGHAHQRVEPAPRAPIPEKSAKRK